MSQQGAPRYTGISAVLGGCQAPGELRTEKASGEASQACGHFCTLGVTCTWGAEKCVHMTCAHLLLLVRIEGYNFHPVFSLFKVCIIFLALLYV